MLIAQVAVGLHGKRTTVFVTELAGSRGNVHARFNATSSKQVA